MKKILIIEIIVLVILLAVSIIVCKNMTQPAVAPETDTKSQGQTDSVQNTQDVQDTQSVQTTTEPPLRWMRLPANRELTAQQYFVYAGDEYLAASHEADQRVYPASITKLFTAYVALQHLAPETAVTAGDELNLVVWGSSVAGIQQGDVLTVEQLVEAMLLPSGNDAAYVLAAAAGRKIAGETADTVKAVNTFMSVMNSQAESLGMTGTNFVNPDGIHDEQHYMTFHDLVLMGQLVMEEPAIMEYAGLDVGNNPRYEEGNQAEDAPKQWKNTNALIHPDNKYYCPYAVGLKTGQTPMAGSCLLSAFEYEGVDYIVGVFGCPEVEDRFADTLQLFNEAIGY